MTPRSPFAHRFNGGRERISLSDDAARLREYIRLIFERSQSELALLSREFAELPDLRSPRTTQ